MARSRLAYACASALAALTISAPALAAGPPSTISGPPSTSDFFGIVSDDTFAGTADYRAAQLSAQREQGVGLIRQTFDWSRIEPVPGTYSLESHDAFVAAAAAHGIRVLPVISHTPDFYSNAGGRSGMHPPRDPGRLADVSRVLVQRYGPGGSFWREHSEVPYLPIRSWQIWNEPNLRAYWPSGPSARRYLALLRPAARAIRGVDRRAEIVSAGVADSRMGVSLTRYVRDLYRAGGRSVFTTLAVHPYARRARDLVATLKDVRRQMDRAGHRRGRLWVTEFGWADAGPPSRYTVGAAGQTRELGRAIKLLGRYRRALRLRGAVYYSWRDGEPYAPHFRDFWGLHTGLVDAGGNPKPAMAAFSRAVASVARRASKR